MYVTEKVRSNYDNVFFELKRYSRGRIQGRGVPSHPPDNFKNSFSIAVKRKKTSCKQSKISILINYDV